MDYFRYLSQSGCYRRQDGVDDAQQFQETRTAMEVMHFSREEQDDIMSLLAGILYLGNVSFTDKIPEAGEAKRRVSIEETEIDQPIMILYSSACWLALRHSRRRCLLADLGARRTIGVG